MHRPRSSRQQTQLEPGEKALRRRIVAEGGSLKPTTPTRDAQVLGFTFVVFTLVAPGGRGLRARLRRQVAPSLSNSSR